MITPIMIDNIGWGTYVFFAAMNACFLPFIHIFYPETKQRSLEEIDLIFAKGFVENMSFFDDDTLEGGKDVGGLEKGEEATVTQTPRI
jgi:hypothetical protein